jgi:hypothetical protein
MPGGADSAQAVEGFPLSVGLGWATTGPGLTLAEAQQLADARLYAEKAPLARRRAS